MRYEFKREDAYGFASHVSAHTREHGAELQFRKCVYCKSGRNGKDDWTFSINLQTGMFKCLRSSCSQQGFFLRLCKDFDYKVNDEFTRYYEKKSTYKKLPQPKKKIEPTPKAIQYLESRKISKETAEKYQISSRKDNESILCFPVFDDNGNLVNIKYRNADYDKTKDKNKEWFEPNCKPFLYGVQTFNGNYDRMIITEGQLDCLSVYESGIENAFSVLGGKNSFTWFPPSYGFITKFSEIIIFGDNEHGKITLLDDMRQRFKGTLKYVRPEDYKDCKDANEILVKYGKEQIKNCIDNAVIVPISQVIELADVKQVNIFDIEKMPTGIKDMDYLLYGGLPFGGLTLLSGKAGEGKLLANETPVLTKNGWKNHGDLVVGDYVVGRNGEWVKVTHIFPKYFANMKVTMKNGEEFFCHENHEWVTNIHCGSGYKERIKTTKEMYEWKQQGHFHPLRLIERAAIIGEEKDLKVDPYTLGAWLGDGRNNNPDICSSKKDYCVIEKVISNGNKVSWQTTQKTGVIYTGFRELRKKLQYYGMCHSRRRVEKFIPNDYLFASLEQRLELLAGLIDTDGSYNSEKGCYIYTTCEDSLRDSVIELIHTFGWDCWVGTQKPRVSTSGIKGNKDTYLINFVARDYEIPVMVERKKNTTKKTMRYGSPIIEKIEYCEHKEGNCIQVDGGIYRIGKTLIPTHNSTLASQMMVNAIESGYKVFAYSGELNNSVFKNWFDMQVAGSDHITEETDRWGMPVYRISNTNRKLIEDWYRGKFFMFNNNDLDGNELTSLCELVEQVIMQYGVRVIFLDNLMTAIDLEQSNGSDKYERQSLFVKRLSRLALKYDVLIVLVAHKRKNNFSTNENDEVMGSSDITNLAMVTIAYEKNDELDPSQRLCKVSKNRLFGKVNTQGWKLEYDDKSKRIYGQNDDLHRVYSWDDSNDGFISADDICAFE